MMDVQATGEDSSPQKRTCSTSKHEISSLFLLLWAFLPFLSSTSQVQDPYDPAPVQDGPNRHADDAMLNYV
jgi:hypothetical protein